MLFGIIQLLYSEMDSQLFDVMLCSDASIQGGSSLYTPYTPYDAVDDTRTTNYSMVVNTDARLPEEHWSLIHQCRWRYKKHINVLGGRALLTGLRWLLHQRLRWVDRVSVITDSQGWFYIIARGWSGAARLCRFESSGLGCGFRWQLQAGPNVGRQKRKPRRCPLLKSI